MPVPPTNSSISKTLAKEIIDEKYHIGEQIVPQSFEITKIKNGTLITDTIEVHGRKMDMKHLRTKMLKCQQPFLKLKSDSEIRKSNQN